GIMLGEISIDRGLQVGDRAEDAAADALPGHFGEEILDGVEPGGRGRGEVEGPARMARQPGQHFGVFVRGIVVMSSTVWITLPAGTWRSMVLRKRMNSLWRWRCMQRPITVPSSTLSAANRVVVPCRLSSCVRVWHRPGLIGNPG